MASEMRTIAVSSYMHSIVPPYIQDRLLAYYEANEKTRAEGRPTTTRMRDPTPVKSFADLQRASNETARTIVQQRSAHLMRAAPSYKHSVASSLLGGPSPKEVWDASSPTRPLLVVSTRPGARVNGRPDGDARAAFANMQKVDDFFLSTFKIYCVNNTTHLMRAYTHHNKAFNNAFWNPGTESIYFGNVDGKIFHPFVTNLGITGHELQHAVTHYYSAGLEYSGQSGALNESVSDVFGKIIEHRQITSTDGRYEDWTIGSGILVAHSGTGTALRSMSHPGTAYKNHPTLGDDPQPAHMRDYRVMKEDNGGVHYNSGIPNRAFYLAATCVQDVGHRRLGSVWFNALKASARSDDFSRFAHRTIQAVGDLKLSDGIRNAVGQGWTEVGVDLRGGGGGTGATARQERAVASTYTSTSARSSTAYTSGERARRLSLSEELPKSLLTTTSPITPSASFSRESQPGSLGQTWTEEEVDLRGGGADGSGSSSRSRSHLPAASSETPRPVVSAPVNPGRSAVSSTSSPKPDSSSNGLSLTAVITMIAVGAIIGLVISSRRK